MAIKELRSYSGYFIVRIFLWVLLSHEYYSLDHFQQRNNCRQKFPDYGNIAYHCNMGLSYIM